MKVRIDKDEAYPVFTVRSTWGRVVDLPDELVDRARRVEEEYATVQEELERAYNAGREATS